ncbi:MULTISPECIES: DUF983 domain-containing protein [unclassified Leisingera]|uniref:DUF983 domain-containing protein n=1 Tax=unclassified Leisingera TaxID=2614906 RepID=UPI00030650A9|nr:MULTISPECIES: DUF983 domain-containing protein [unclassified Leisingera]KIC26062.1 zinc-finger protein [Leisingera sp. ANG-S3]KIC53211.1 zinc-finger protein [Leisingera sp. ANG-S]KID08340.1 zinc-finger protein [Leisingera sp. ANG1]
MTQSPAVPASEDERPTMPALAKGWRCRCPECGKGKLLHSYLKVNETCSNCGLDLTHARADDGPAYLTILIVGHIMAPMMHVVYFSWRPEPLVMFAVFSIGCLASSLYLLPRMKGIVIAYQWARRMHGFGKDTPAAPAEQGQ